LTLYPLDSFVGKTAQGNDRLLKMFCECVLGAIVTQTLQRLNKHHHGGNTNSRDLGRIVKWP
jgi:hypothetical protein